MSSPVDPEFDLKKVQKRKKKKKKRKEERKRNKSKEFLSSKDSSTNEYADTDSLITKQTMKHEIVDKKRIPATKKTNDASLDAKMVGQKNSDRDDHHKSKKRKLSNNVFKQEPNMPKSPSSENSTHKENKFPRYSFPVDDTDHCETPLKAYQDIVDVLDKLASSLHKNRSSLQIYDPYYCDGGVKKKLASFGFTSVTNRNRDFYKDIANQTIPEYDVLVTNPPYSGVHMEKILAFCSNPSKEQNQNKRKKPFLLLLPHFVYTKDYYSRALSQTTSLAMFFLVPEVRYSYIPPSWVSEKSGSKALEHGKTKTAPFPSFWYCHIPNLLSKWLIEKFGPSGMVRPQHKSKLRYAKNRNDIPRDFRGEFDPNKKRANPKARKRAAKKRREAAMKARTT